MKTPTFSEKTNQIICFETRKVAGVAAGRVQGMRDLLIRFKILREAVPCHPESFWIVKHCKNCKTVHGWVLELLVGQLKTKIHDNASCLRIRISNNASFRCRILSIECQKVVTAWKIWWPRLPATHPISQVRQVWKADLKDVMPPNLICHRLQVASSWVPWGLGFFECSPQFSGHNSD